MTKIGWMSDSHNREDKSGGALGALTTDMQTLVDTVGVSDIYWTGDQVHPTDKSTRPHYPADKYNAFWDYVDDSGYYGRVAAAIPGNHEVPVGNWLKSDPKAVRRFHKRYSDGLTVLALNTVASGFMTGAGSLGTQGGVGPNIGKVSYNDVYWMKRKLANAPDTDTKLVFFHHPPFFIEDSSLQASNITIDHTPYSPDQNYRTENRYDVCLNWFDLHQELAQQPRVVVPVSHIYQFSYEGSVPSSSTSFGGNFPVDYVYKKHYYKGVPTTGVETYAYIDADSTGVTITTKEHSTGATTTILDKTW